MAEDSKKINCLSHTAVFDYIRIFHANDPEVYIDPYPTRIIPIELKDCYQPITIKTERAIRPKSVVLGLGTIVENWIIHLN